MKSNNTLIRIWYDYFNSGVLPNNYDKLIGSMRSIESMYTEVCAIPESNNIFKHAVRDKILTSYSLSLVFKCIITNTIINYDIIDSIMPLSVDKMATDLLRYCRNLNIYKYLLDKKYLTSADLNNAMYKPNIEYYNIQDDIMNYLIQELQLKVKLNATTLKNCKCDENIAVMLLNLCPISLDQFVELAHIRDHMCLHVYLHLIYHMSKLYPYTDNVQTYNRIYEILQCDKTVYIPDSIIFNYFYNIGLRKEHLTQRIVSIIVGFDRDEFIEMLTKLKLTLPDIKKYDITNGNIFIDVDITLYLIKTYDLDESDLAYISNKYYMHMSITYLLYSKYKIIPYKTYEYIKSYNRRYLNDLFTIVDEDCTRIGQYKKWVYICKLINFTRRKKWLINTYIHSHIRAYKYLEIDYAI